MKFLDILVSKEEQTGATRHSRACAEIYEAPTIARMRVQKAPTAQKFYTPRHKTKRTTTEVSPRNDQ